MSRILELLEDGVRKKVFTGASYQIGTKERILEEGAAGTLGEGLETAAIDSLFDMASVTKILTALGFMKLLEEGKVCLGDTVGRYLKEYRNSEKSGITMYELLTHTSVIWGQVPLYQSCQTRKELLDSILYLPPRDREKTPVMYSSQGFIVLGEVMGRIADMPFHQVLKKYVFEPLEMENTCFNPGAHLKPRIAATEFCPWRNCRVIGQVHDENAVVMGGVCGHAGVFSNIPDMSKVARAMFSERYLPNSLIKLMAANHTVGMNLARGLGWQCKDHIDSPCGDLFSSRSFGHTGFTGTSIWMDPERDLYAILLTNRVYYSRNADEISHVRRVFHNLAVLEWERLGR